MIPESAEVRSDQPAPSEPLNTILQAIVQHATDAGMNFDDLRVLNRLIEKVEQAAAQPPAAPSLREALERLDGAFQWIREEYPKALVAMPREHYEAFANARAALASSDPGSPSDGGLDE